MAAALSACENKRAPARTAEETTPVVEFHDEPIQPLPKAPPQDPRIVRLGEKLYHDKRLSSDKTVACASCHVIAEGGDDNRKTSIGIQGLAGGINAPTVLNAGLNFVQFWDGRAATLEDQAGGPVENPIEMGNTIAQLLVTLKGDPEYARDFGAAFPDGVTEANFRKAVATFERTLMTPNSRFDRWLSGDASAATASELAGYELFKRVGCIACHQGENAGGNMFQRFGVMGDYFKDRGDVTAADYGRFNVTHVEADRFVFRVPTLRNVELTAPYFHDGFAETLPEAVRIMARYQLGRTLSDNDVDLLVGFLKSLTGELPRVSSDALKLSAGG
jgi:cytochrome c peroxidase